MKKILAAVDGSEASLHALHDAEELAKELNAELTLVYVAPPFTMPMEFSPTPGAYLGESDRIRGERILNGALRELHGVPARTANLRGPPADTIAELASNEDFDLVVVGNEGRGAIGRMLLGSVADRLVHVCRRPVMVVR
jgi:nucleotide-binding universal stress UspA family protein